MKVSNAGMSNARSGLHQAASVRSRGRVWVSFCAARSANRKAGVTARQNPPPASTPHAGPHVAVERLEQTASSLDSVLKVKELRQPLEEEEFGDALLDKDFQVEKPSGATDVQLLPTYMTV